MALELHERGTIEGIFPVMIGDKRPDGECSNYFSSSWNPNPPDIVVHALESKLIGHLGREGLGSLYVDRVPIKSICSAILSSQGGFYSGRKEDIFDPIVVSISSMEYVFSFL